MDPAARLAQDLEGEPLVRAYLFGSQARGEGGPLSDVDLAVLPDATVAPGDRLLLQGRLSLRAAALFKVDRCDVVLLDEAPPGLAFEAIRGRLLLERDPEGRVVFEARIMSTYHDRQAKEARWDRETLERFLKGGFA